MADEPVRPPDIWDRDAASAPRPKPGALDSAAWQLPALRWYQTTSLARWRTAGRRGVLALPTGSGKTLVALAAIAELGVPALILVPTRVLLDQWAEALSRCWRGEVGRLGDGEYRVGAITVSTFASAVIWAPRIGDRFGLVIVDEAHHVGAWCPGEVLEMLVAPARMGLTATPPPPGGELGERIGPVIYSLGVDELTGDALAEYKVINVPITLGPRERELYKAQRGKFAHVYAKHARRERGDLQWRQFVRNATRSTEGREALEAWKDYRALIAYPVGKQAALRELLAKHPGERALVFTADNATAYRIARELLVVPITHEIGRAERAQILERFRSGEITVLVSSQVLDEGFDVPDADIAIIVGGSSSPRRQVQRIGRVLRPREGKKALIYELAVDDTTEVDYVRRRRAGLDLPVRAIGTSLARDCGPDDDTRVESRGRDATTRNADDSRAERSNRSSTTSSADRIERSGRDATSNVDATRIERSGRDATSNVDDMRIERRGRDVTTSNAVDMRVELPPQIAKLGGAR